MRPSPAVSARIHLPRQHVAKVDARATQRLQVESGGVAWHVEHDYGWAGEARVDPGAKFLLPIANSALTVIGKAAALTVHEREAVAAERVGFFADVLQGHLDDEVDTQ